MNVFLFQLLAVFVVLVPGYSETAVGAGRILRLVLVVCDGINEFLVHMLPWNFAGLMFLR